MCSQLSLRYYYVIYINLYCRFSFIRKRVIKSPHSLKDVKRHQEIHIKKKEEKKCQQHSLQFSQFVSKIITAVRGTNNSRKMKRFYYEVWPQRTNASFVFFLFFLK